jgi:quercetin dioxygenase-like cupin family protein
MRLVDFRPDRGWNIDVFGSKGMTQAPITAPLASGGPFQAACFRLEPGGRMGRHPATYPHLFAVVDGTGWVSGADGKPHAIGAGEAVFWETGEDHEIWTDDGLTMIVIEGNDEAQPYESRPLS